MRPDWRARGHAGWWAFLAHRLSGLALALFLPLHFWALGHALRGEAALDGFLRWVDRPLFKAGEWGMVLLLSIHLAGGVRLLALELLPWREGHKTMLAVALGAAAALALAFGLALL